MDDTVNTDVQNNGNRNYTVHLQNKSDGTGESAVTKVDISTLSAGPDGVTTPVSLSLKSVQYDIGGFSSVQLFWDATTDDEMLTLSAGQGFLDFTDIGHLKDPRSTGYTGDVKLTTVGAAADATYDITLHFVKKL